LIFKILNLSSCLSQNQPKSFKESLKRKERNLVKKQQIKKARKEFNKLLAEAKLEEAKKRVGYVIPLD